MNNPFHIPDLTPMYNAVRDYIKEHQGEKGYISTWEEGFDILWTMIYTGYDSEYEEQMVYAVRVKNDDIQIVYDTYRTKYTDEYIASLGDEDWYSIRYDDCIVYLPTIFSIAESIESYVEEPK